MKVDVLQVQDATFTSKWSWWSNWIDVATFTHGYTGYLLQMKISRTNAKKFKAVAFKGFGQYADVSAHEAGNLIQMGKKINEENSEQIRKIVYERLENGVDNDADYGSMSYLEIARDLCHYCDDLEKIRPSNIKPFVVDWFEYKGLKNET